ncbi:MULTISPECIES: class I SAM-dependent DNA methyltransferase [unclassified Flavobacterium]|uniref:class I SAM-dependent DNA methyltransferase n=1 Tax=unclassified Flavobacterium TaxID=196869 RepID=UPI000EAD560A|nr:MULTISPECIES: DNA methyltransferase [unclassified Flavobacterium]RKS03267.1 type II restriction/modification system DNA methylase subunit YeeA [Flavobacterium sp. 102]
MALSWNEIKDRAIKFSKEWADTANEEADAKPFLDAFFDVFGITRKKIGTFEHRVKKISDADGYIDLLWKGTILVEMKSRGKNLDKAFIQAKDYTHGLKQNELPKYILVCDFDIFRLYDTEEQKTTEFKLADLYLNVQSFGYLLGYQKKVYKEQDPANIKAAELMGKLHDRLEEIGYDGHPLEVYLVRILFCLFAEDTTIFNKQQFQDYIEQRTADDGSDLAARIQELFQVLNTPIDKRFKNLDEQLNEFPYVNGKLFEEVLPSASFDTKMRQALLDCCYIDWSKISPAIFGSMFQSVMNPKERRNLGAHYTSETNILKLIKPLFLDDLWTEFKSIKTNKNKLAEFHKRISTLKFLDPACGCGNFLVITYRELRLLELEILRATYKSGQGVLDVREIMYLDVDMMYGIEYEEFPARIAEVAMWLIDHQMNMMISNEFGQYFVRLPLKKAAKIVHGNALRIDWNNLDDATHFNIKANVTNIYNVNEPIETYDVLNIYSKTVNVNPVHSLQNSNSGKCSFDYIVGNPPFIGKKEQNASQKNDVEIIFKGIKGTGLMDYVSCWYVKAAQLIHNTKTKVAFVSTNSITQGEQVNILWNLLLNYYRVKIHFAHRTFSWSNEAKGNAAVHCVIVGFANFDTKNKTIYEYEDIKGESHAIKVKNINPYLVEAKDIFIDSKRNPICVVPEINYGSFALDDGKYTLSEKDRQEIIAENKNSETLIKPFIGGRELLHSEKRYCLWLFNVNPNKIRENSKIIERVNAVKKWRANSDRVTTKKLSETPTVFAEIRQPNSNYLAFPTVSSVNRKYIPIGFLEPNIIASNQLYIIPNATLFHFGVLTSLMHISWIKNICGRLKSDYRYSSSIVYNNYPWPENPTDKQVKAIEEKAQAVLDARAAFPNSSLADLYDPLTMPPALVKAHNELDKAVDTAYSKQAFTSEAKRMEFLFELYEKYTADLFSKEKKGKKN